MTSAESSAGRSWCRGCTTDATRRSSSRPTRHTGTKAPRRRGPPRSRRAAMFAGDFSGWRDANGNLIPIYDPATTRLNPNGSGFTARSVSGKYDPARTVQPNLARSAAVWRPCGPTCRACATISSTRRAMPSARTRGTNSASSSITTSRATDRLGFLLHWGEVLVIPPSGGPAGGLPVPLEQFPRRRLAHLCVPDELGSRDQPDAPQSCDLRA